MKKSNTLFQPITSLMREQLKVKTQGKLTLNESDNLFKTVQKLANFIVKNTHEISSEEICESLEWLYSGFEFSPISLTDSNLNIDKCKEYLRGFSDLVPDMDRIRLFKSTSNEEKSKSRLYIVSDSIPFKDHRVFWRNLKQDICPDFERLTVLSISKLIGLKRLFELVKQNFDNLMSSNSTHLGFNQIDLDYIFTRVFHNSKNGGKKFDYTYSNQNCNMLVKAYIFDKDGEFENLKEKYGIQVNTDLNRAIIKDGLDTYYLPHEKIEQIRNGEVSDGWMRAFAYQFIKTVIIEHYHNDQNVQLMNKYTKESAAQYARAFETKKNIPIKTLNAMETSRFLKDFSFVEYDESIDINKMARLEQEWEKFAAYLPKPLNGHKAALRFRFLGRHKARGIFFPGIDTIALDPREMSDGSLGVTSFVHEFGHFLDFNHTFERPLSLENKFSTILDYYQEKIERCIDDSSRLKYFKTPTEVFARSFEVYFAQFDNVISSFNDRELPGLEYEPLKEMLPDINAYFNQIFPGLSERLQSFEPQSHNSNVIEAKYINKATANGSVALRVVENVTFIEQLSLFDL